MNSQGTYRQVNDTEVNCLEYALLLDEDAGFGLTIYSWDPEYNSEYFIGRIISYLDGKGFRCRSLESYDEKIYYSEHRIAVRVPNAEGYWYHFIYQLSDGTWAGKDYDHPSEHFGRGNPSNSPVMWNRDAYSPKAGTLYFAVSKKIQD